MSRNDPNLLDIMFGTIAAGLGGPLIRLADEPEPSLRWPVDRPLQPRDHYESPRPISKRRARRLRGRKY